MGRLLFHPLIAGLILTAVLAAIMSTISSQLLVSSTSLIEDVYKIFGKRDLSEKALINLSRGSVIAVSLVAGLLSINPADSILNLVGFAWAGFGSAFGPVVLCMLYWKRLNVPGALAGMIAGAAVVALWKFTGLDQHLYEMVPGFIAGTLAIVVVSLATKAPSQEVIDTFDRATEREKNFTEE